ncbi:MAG: Ig domain-containing protein, partial [Clostridia bacterium]|nr:Ig domain-containing protein [Clostridia bacterium]
MKLYTDETCSTEVGADATETLTVYVKSMEVGDAIITAVSNANSALSADCAVTVYELEPVSYLAWDEASQRLVNKTGDEACAAYVEGTAETTSFENGKWYVFCADTTVSNRITVNGTAHLILKDDVTLTVPKGITTTGATLNIYGQRAGTGTLSAGAGSYNAGIGGTAQSDGGTVVIHSGTVTATGGAQAAGIGGGVMGTGGQVTIYGGTVTATGGRDAAGIGGGYRGAGGKVIIGNGTVVANGTQDGSTGGAGIGGGTRGAGGEVIMNGGDVTATGAFGAGIGGGTYGAGGTVTITGGTVKAYSKGTTSSFGAAIGAGSGNSEQGTLTLAENMIVKAETVALADKEWEDLQEVAREDYMNDHAQRRAYLMTPVVAVTGVTLDQEAVTLNIGDTAPLTATVEPADATDKAVAWTSDNTAAVTVDENGVVTAVAPGTANVTAATADGGFTAVCAVTVNAVDPDVPTGLTATYGQTLADVALPEGWAWADATAAVGNAGANTFKANYTSTDPYYNSVSNVDVTVTVGKADPAFTAPAALAAHCGDTLADVSLPDGFAWNDAAASVGTAGEKTFAATYTPADTDNYNTASVDLTVTVSHDLVDYDGQPATCVEKGWNAYRTCTGCDYTTYEEIQPTGIHEWEWVADTDADCGNPGVKHQECQNCDAVQAEGTVIPATGAHEWEWVADTDADCGNPGVKHQECKNCDAVQAEGTVISATGHHQTELVGANAATATEDGYTGDKVCTVCGQTVQTGKVIPATGAQ